MNKILFFQVRFNVFIAVGIWLIYLSTLGFDNAFYYISENLEIFFTMIFGSLIAGATSEGGGAVAFPVFTKILKITPHDAKVFSLAIQSVGMTVASLFIIYTRVLVEWRVILWAGLGGIVGIIIGTGVLASILPANIIKITFTMLVGSLAIVLVFIYRHNAERNFQLPKCGFNERNILFITGMVGGVLSGLVGNGIDIITFSVMVLFFRLSEKVATPTSVILMACNAIVGFVLYLFVYDGFTETVQEYWLAAVPVVVIGAPLGAMICTWFSRELIVRVLLALIAIEVVSSLLIIPLSSTLILYSVIVLSVCSFIYYQMYQVATCSSLANTASES